MYSNKKLPLDLLILLIWTMLTFIFVLTPALNDTYARTVLGIPMVLFIPGYVLIAALFPGKYDIGAIERVALSLGFSVAVSSLLGLALNFTFGIKLLPVLLTLCIFTIILIFVAAYRRGQLSDEERFTVPFYRVYDIISNEIKAPESRTDMVLTGILIFSIVFAAGLIFTVFTSPGTGERFTEFYILNTSGKAWDYPTSLTLDRPAELLVGVVNHEYATVNYTLQVALDRGVLTDLWFTLGNNETWEKNITYVPDKEGKNMKLEFLLFKEDNFTAPYRELHLWVNVTK